MFETSEWNFVGAAYGLTWVVLIGYAVYLAARIRRARTALEQNGGDAEVQS